MACVLGSHGISQIKSATRVCMTTLKDTWSFKELNDDVEGDNNEILVSLTKNCSCGTCRNQIQTLCCEIHLEGTRTYLTRVISKFQDKTNRF